jgi:hypothetical protein
MAGVRCGIPLEEYTILLLSTQMWIAFPGLPSAWLSCAVPFRGVIRDLEDPDRDMVEMRVAARHSGMAGAAAEADLQDIRHLSRVTAEVRKLKNPRCARQEEQKTFRLGV